MYKYDYQQVLQFLNKNSAKNKDLEKEVKRKQKENDDLMDRLSRIDVNMNELNQEIGNFEEQTADLPSLIK
jgi:predicted nuclease with TOPRIM domain|tara:strand:+ start:947 stop:1159 length:213 start_codon:yes stop_codon:yes gene_type:complete